MKKMLFAAMLAACVGVLGMGRPWASAGMAAAPRVQAPALANRLTFSIRLPEVLGGSECPPGTPTPRTCLEQTTVVSVRGLGRVDLDVYHVVDARTSCPRGTVRGTLTTPRGWFSVSGVAPDCVNDPWGYGIYNIALRGSDAYSGAAGTGTVDSSGGSWTLAARVTAAAPMFDLTPPRMTGIRARTVHAKMRRSVRVRFSVRALDDVDGAVRAVCRPHSGSLFRVGRTRITCRATDSSANTTTQRFLVRVVR